MLKHRMGDADFYCFRLEAWRQIPRRAAYTNLPTTFFTAKRQFSSIVHRSLPLAHRPWWLSPLFINSVH